MLTTSQLRTEWAPACPSGDLTRVSLHGDGIVSVRRSIVSAVQALDACLAAHGYRTRKADTGAYNCRRITGGTGYSLHAYGIAIDINWQTNPYGRTLRTDMPSVMVRDIKAIRTRSGKQVWRWGGDYQTNKDAMHYEIVCRRPDLATGIDPATVPGGRPAQPYGLDVLRPGDDDRTRGDHRVAGVQMMLDALANRWGDATLHPGPVDGVYGARTEAAVRAFKRRIIALQRATHQAPWPNDDAIVGPATYGALEFWVRVP